MRVQELATGRVDTRCRIMKLRSRRDKWVVNDLRRSHSLVAAVALLLLGFQSVCSPRLLAATKQGMRSFDIGNQWAGAQGSYSLAGANRAKYAHSELGVGGSVRFLKMTAKAVEFSATVENNNGTKTAVYRLDVAGVTVDSGRKSATYKWSKPVAKTLVQGSVPVMLGPVPVTLRGSVGGGASIGYSLGLSASGASLDGSASTWMTGSASAGLGVPLLNLALRSDLQLGTTTLQAGVQVTPSVLSGRADLVFDPVKIDLGLAVQSGGKVLYRQDLASYSASSKNTNLVRF